MSALDTQVGGDHYKKLKIQPVEYMHANGIPFIEGCIIKYASRWRDKGGIADLEKIKHFAQLLIDLETSQIEPTQEEPSHIISDIPSWDDAPEWAEWLGQGMAGDWEFYEDKPTPSENRNYWNHQLRGQTTDFRGPANPYWLNTLQSRPARTAK